MSIETGNRQAVGVELLHSLDLHEKNLAELLHGLAYPLRRRLIGDEPHGPGENPKEPQRDNWTDQVRNKIFACDALTEEITKHLQALMREFGDTAERDEPKSARYA